MTETSAFDGSHRAIIAMSFESSEIGQLLTGMVAYGTAVIGGAE